MKAASVRKTTVKAKRNVQAIVHDALRRNVVVKQNPFTRRWYVMEEESTIDYMKLRYSVAEFGSKPEANDAMIEGKVAFSKWEIF